MGGDELTVLKLVANRLEAAGMAYMVTGSIAMAAYARPRMTRDIDLVLELGEADVPVLLRLFSPDFLVNEEESRQAAKGRGMFNLIHSESIVKVDCIVRKEHPYRREEFRRRRRLELAGQALWVVSPEDLILSKLVWMRDSRSELQMRDITALIRDPNLDMPYLQRWAAELDVAGLLAEARQL